MHFRPRDHTLILAAFLVAYVHVMHLNLQQTQYNLPKRKGSSRIDMRIETKADPDHKGSRPASYLVKNPVVGWRYFLPGQRLHSQLNSMHHCPLASTILYCFVTDCVNKLPRICYTAVKWLRVKGNNALPLHHHAIHAMVPIVKLLIALSVNTPNSELIDWLSKV